jgi:hypothetical protein
MLIFQRAIGQWFAWKNPLQSDPFYPFIFWALNNKPVWWGNFLRTVPAKLSEKPGNPALISPGDQTKTTNHSLLPHSMTALVITRRLQAAAHMP